MSIFKYLKSKLRGDCILYVSFDECVNIITSVKTIADNIEDANRGRDIKSAQNRASELKELHKKLLNQAKNACKGVI